VAGSLLGGSGAYPGPAGWENGPVTDTKLRTPNSDPTERPLSDEGAGLELAASRRRLLGAESAERRRIERTIHAGVQQQVVASRIKLALAIEAMQQKPSRGMQLLADLGRDLDVAIEELRALAQGIYPALLTSYGLGEALRSAGRRLPCSVSVQAQSIGRYSMDTESAVYFCCLEALQSLAVASDRDATLALRLWEEGNVLRFEMGGSGVRFARSPASRGSGFAGMRDRIAAVGGTLTEARAADKPTILRGAVPVTELEVAARP